MAELLELPSMLPLSNCARLESQSQHTLWVQATSGLESQQKSWVQASSVLSETCSTAETSFEGSRVSKHGFLSNGYATQRSPRHPGFRHSPPRETEDKPGWAVDEEVAMEGVLRERCEGGKLRDAVGALDLLVQRGFSVRDSVFYRVLSRCIAQKDLALGVRVHRIAARNGCESNPFLANHIVGMYASHGRLDDAVQVFYGVTQPDAYLWATIILAHVRCGEPMEGVKLYRRMRVSSVEPDNHVFVAVLKACAAAEDLGCGKEVHAEIVASAVKVNMFVGNSLVSMYAKCGSLEDASRVFRGLPRRDVVTWNAMIAGYSQQGLGREALALYASMEQEGTPANQVTFVCLLQACASVGELEQGKQLHLQIHERNLEADVSVGTSLVDMYCKCGSLVDARTVLDRLATRNVVTWNAMISGYVQQGLGHEALALYASMQEEGITSANNVTFACLLQACVSVGALQEGKQLHAEIDERGLDTDTLVGNSLVDMYSKCGSLRDARRVFDSLPKRDVVTWTAMVTAYAEQGLGYEALGLYARMQQEAITPANEVTFVALLHACAGVRALPHGKALHVQLLERGLEADLFVGSSLVDMYAKCGSLEDARIVFDRLPKKNLVTWTAMLAGYVQYGFGQEALDLYKTMELQGIQSANRVTFMCLLQACARIGDLHHGKQLHSQIQERGLEVEVSVGNCLVDMYTKCGSLDDARIVFERLPTRDVVTWNSMIAGYMRQGLGGAALALYESMQEEGLTLANHVTFVCLLQACGSVGALHNGKLLHTQIRERGLESDDHVASSLIDMYCKCGSLVDARRVLDRRPAGDVVTWSALLKGYAENSDGHMAVQCFEEMRQQGVQPDETTFICLLVACSHAGLVREGQEYFRMMLEDYGITPTDYHRNCMVDLLARSGCLDEAEYMLQTVSMEHHVVGWISLLSACKGHGDVERGRRCFDHLVRLEPDNATPYILLGNILATEGRWKDVLELENLRKAAGAWKKPAKACIEVQNKVHEFTVGEDRSDISSKLRTMTARLKEEGGHVAQTELVLKAVSEREKENALCGHAEKLALAYGLLNTPDGSTLLVTKNLRMCSDCHSSTKIMSRLEKREILVRDAHRVHRFVDGSCSCGDRH